MSNCDQQSCPLDSNDVMSYLMGFVTISIYFLVVYWAVMYLIKRDIYYLSQIIVSITEKLVNKVIKDIIKQPRPVGACSTSYGMPSNHVAFLTIVLAWELLWNYKNSKKINPLQILLYIFYIVLEAYSRIFLRYHTLEQTIAGFIFGIIYTALFYIVWNKIVGKRKIE